ncbi:hypothetical protein ACJX0J_017834, partial [Zea mays]
LPYLSLEECFDGICFFNISYSIVSLEDEAPRECLIHIADYNFGTFLGTIKPS